MNNLKAKLEARNYSEVTADERILLQKALEEAPYLFRSDLPNENADRSSAPARSLKRIREEAILPQTLDPVPPDPKTLRRSLVGCFESRKDKISKSGDMKNSLSVFSDRSELLEQRLTRLFDLAFYQRYKEYHRSEVSQDLARRGFIVVGEKEENRIKAIRLRGKRWDRWAEVAATEYGFPLRQLTGILLVFNKQGSSWTEVKENDCKQALMALLKGTQLHSMAWNCTETADALLGQIWEFFWTDCLPPTQGLSVSYLCVNDIHVFVLLLGLLEDNADIPIEIIEIASKTRTRWAENGLLQPYDPVGLWSEQPVAKDLRGADADQLRRAIDILSNRGLISVDRARLKLREELRDKLTNDPVLFAARQSRRTSALGFLSYFFAGFGVTGGFGTSGRKVLPYFQLTVRGFVENYKNESEDSFREIVFEALLGASRFSDLNWKEESLQMAKKIYPHNLSPVLQAHLTLRQSSVLRFAGKLKESADEIDRFLALYPAPPRSDVRLYARCGQIRYSASLNQFEKGEFDCALEISNAWFGNIQQTEENTYVLTAVRKHLIIRGRIAFMQGRYAMAVDNLKAVLQVYNETHGGRFSVLSYLMDAFNGLKDPHRGLSLLEQDEKDEFGDLVLRSRRLFALSSAEAALYADRYQKAEEILKKLLAYHRSENRLDPNDQWNFVRTLLSWAQLQQLQASESPHWSEALNRWREVQRIWKMYNIGPTDCADFSMIHVSTEYVFRRLQPCQQMGPALIVQATNAKEKGILWFPSLRTFWFE